MAYYTPSLPSQPDAEYIRADLLARAIQTALEMAKEADAEYWGQPSVVSKRISEIRVEDVLEKMEASDDTDDLVKRLRDTSNMIALGDRIQWGLDSHLMDAAADRIEALEAELAEARHHLDNMLFWVDGLTHDLDDLPVGFREDYNAAAAFVDGDSQCESARLREDLIAAEAERDWWKERAEAIAANKARRISRR